MIFEGFHRILWYSMIIHDVLWTFMRLASFCTLVLDSSGDFRRRILGHLRSFAKAIESCQPSSLDLWVLVIAAASNCEGAILCSQALVLHDFPGSYDFPPYSMIFCDNLWSSMVVHNILWYFCDILWYSMAFDNIPWSSIIFYERLCVWHLFILGLWFIWELPRKDFGLSEEFRGSDWVLSALIPRSVSACYCGRKQLRRRDIVFTGIGTPWSTRILWFPTVFYDILWYSMIFHGSP